MKVDAVNQAGRGPAALETVPLNPWPNHRRNRKGLWGAGDAVLNPRGDPASRAGIHLVRFATTV